jgi:radical SAM superfamily enzyme YgiQ (UPF0313 family)
LLIGFESLKQENLKRMNKGFNLMKGGYEKALENLRRHGIRLYVTFILGYDEDDADTMEETLAFAQRNSFYIVAFNHLTPFPGTPLYERLQREGRLLYDRWWLDPNYRYGMIPFAPRGMTPEELQERCMEARRRFYSYSSIIRRSLDLKSNGGGWFMWSHFYSINLLFRREVMQRKNFPLGDDAYQGTLLKAEHSVPFDASVLTSSV